MDVLRDRGGGIELIGFWKLLAGRNESSTRRTEEVTQDSALVDRSNTLLMAYA